MMLVRMFVISYVHFSREGCVSQILTLFDWKLHLDNTKQKDLCFHESDVRRAFYELKPLSVDRGCGVVQPTSSKCIFFASYGLGSHQNMFQHYPKYRLKGMNSTLVII